MARIETSLFDIGAFDLLAREDTAVHRLDPRAKLVTTLVFVVTVVSFGKYEVSALVPFCLFPVVMAARAGIPAGFLARRLLLAAPFVLGVGLFNPFFDREVLFHFGPLGISGGWVSLTSLLLRFALTVGAALVLLATTGFTGICLALERLGTPRPLVLQLLFLHRYLFVLVEEGLRLSRARALRSFDGRGTGVRVFGHLAGQLLLRSIDRAQRIHRAMLGRAFAGEIRRLQPLRFGRADLLFTGGCCAAFLLLRFWNLPQAAGRFLAELLS